MTSLRQRTAKHFVLIKAARQLKGEIEKAGLDNLRLLADNGVSIMSTYLSGCTPEERAGYRRDFSALVAMDITPEMVLVALVKEMPELAPILEANEHYKDQEILTLRAVLLTPDSH